MPRKPSVALEQLREFDSKRQVTRKSTDLASAKGHLVKRMSSDFGRTAEYYWSIHDAFLRHVGDPKNKHVLHVASAAGIYTRFLQHKGAKAVAFDLSEDAASISKAIRNKKVVRGSAKMGPIKNHQGFWLDWLRHNNLPFKDNSFDVFLSDHFLFAGYVNLESKEAREEGSIKLLKELHRVLKPGGVGIVANYWTRLFHLNQIKIIRGMGFEVTKEKTRLLVLRKL